MTENQIRCFKAVCDTMNFTQAANVLYISQPAVSRSITALERELGADLFVRVNNSLTLTQAGKLFLEFGEKLAADYGSLLHDLEALKTGRGQTLRLGCQETWEPAHFLPELEKCFQTLCPGGRLTVEAHKLSELLLMAQEGKLDVVLTHQFFRPSSLDMKVEQLCSTGLGLLYSRRFAPEPVDFASLAGMGFMLYDADIEKRFSAAIQEICRKRGIEPKFTNTGRLATALFEVSRGGGVMIFTDWDNMIENSAYGYFPIEETLPVCFAYSAERSMPLTAEFVKRAKQSGRKYGAF